MQREIRKIVTYQEDILIEGFKPAPSQWVMSEAAAVVTNPWVGRYIEDLKPVIQAYGPELDAFLTRRNTDMTDGGDKIEAFGKLAVVGLDGEIEHASGLIHTLRLGNHFRVAVGAKSYLAFTNIPGGAGSSIQIPLMDKNDAGRRSHYLTIRFSIPDAPRAKEIVVALGAAIAGRPHHRIGDRYQDLKDLGNDVDNPAAV